MDVKVRWITLLMNLLQMVDSIVGHGERPYYIQDNTEDLKPQREFVEGLTGKTDWWKVGQAELNRALNLQYINKRAKNVILFVGDGMGYSTTTAARIYHAQLRGKIGYEANLAWDNFPFSGASKTYTVDSQVADSANAATALLSGVKANQGTLGVNQFVKKGDCDATQGNAVKSILHYAIEAGKSTGIITTTTITHATPAAAYAACPHRDWEADCKVPPEYRYKCLDIAQQLIDGELNKNINVLLGGGRQMFHPVSVMDDEYPDDERKSGCRLDNRTLTEEWLEQKRKMGKTAAYVQKKSDFDAVDPATTDYLMGLFEPSYMQFEAARASDKGEWGEPSIADMTKKALDILSKSTEGYFLLVEGGRIDHAHHFNQAAKALNETVALSDAVSVAMEMTDSQETLVVVTSDHSHTMTISGYNFINKDITGLIYKEDGNLQEAMDEKPSLVLGYASGPGFTIHKMSESGDIQPRKNLSDEQQIGSTEFLYDTTVWDYISTHSGEDVPIFAQGPMAHLFHGTHEQSYIAHAMMYASCLGPNKHHCDQKEEDSLCNNGATIIKPFLKLLIALFGLYYIQVL